jgi:VIT1/CCC1 family predicted Fe2+/Mn2+ transporter
MADDISEHHHDHHHDRPHQHMVHRHRDVSGGTARATVFGISDGLVSNVALILGVAAADATRSSVLVAGVAGLLAGATSMAAGEYVSMKAQSELIERELEIERQSISRDPALETRELAAIYRNRGLDQDQALEMAEAVMSDPETALEVHAREELGIAPDATGNPQGAAVGSFIAFSFGALVPLLPWFFGEGAAAVIASAIVGLIATFTVGAILARFTERSVLRTAGRQVAWAVAACTATSVIGSWLGAVV